ncbi:hypothetical protein MKW98_021411 [Papaver atlanticum]|uniref:Uncharacterized protein n=1 Tax=Papaver atlanticum TaxID=357466 RepID=A0AAD4XJ71_9MAGN|nr:hypothetical protein MKW98_021411 [Papaver atlanticum]
MIRQYYIKNTVSLRKPRRRYEVLMSTSNSCVYIFITSIEFQKMNCELLTGFMDAENRPDKSGDCEEDEREKRGCFEASTSKRRRLVEEPKSMIARLLDSKDENPSYKRSTRKNNQICLFASGISTDPGDDQIPHYEPKKNTETSSEYFKHSIYEEKMFKCEDERRAEELVAKFDDDNSISLIYIKDHFSVPHRGCIKRLFGNLGQLVMDSFRDNAILVLPLISTRLHQKLQEVSDSLLNSEKELKLVSSSNSSFELQNTTSSSTKDDAYTSWPNPLAELIV